MPSNAQVPGIPTPRADVQSLLATVQALKQTIEVMQGRTGDGTQTVALSAQVEALAARVKALGG